RLAGGILPPFLLRAQEQLEVHLGVRIHRIQREGGAVVADGLLRMTHRLVREGEMVGGLRLEVRISALEGLRRLAGRFRCLRWIELEEHGRAVEGEAGILRQPRAGAVVFAQRAFGIVLRGQGVSLGDVVVLPLVQATRERLPQPRDDAGGLALLRHDHHAFRRGEQDGEEERAHAGLRRSGPSPSAAAAQSRANAGQANQAYLSSYWTERRDSISPFWIFSSSGRNFSTPRSAPEAVSKRPLPRAVRSRRPAASVR